MTGWLAHSAGKKPSVPSQTYSEHVSNVMRRVDENLDRLSRYYKGNTVYFCKAVRVATVFHDMGKLDSENQNILEKGGGKHLPVNHVDAGAALLLEKDLIESALLVYAHHRGLCSVPEECAKEEFFLRDPDTAIRTKQNLLEYLSRHSASGFSLQDKASGVSSDWNGLTRRIGLSCLVDADHGDTARNYGKEFPVTCLEPRWKERLDTLDRYVSGLAKDSDAVSERNQLRQKIYQACREADTTLSLYACDSPVGTGKTTAVMAHLLRAAIDKNLRHIIVVLPYTNIIKQSVDVYRKALVLPGENADEVIAEHHHQADFEAIEVRQLATLWQAPVIVTTAVQFFETIASNHPSKLRKLHELPGSAVFIDEAHAAIPTHLWPQTWKWLKNFSENWRCHFVFASGSLPRFWELKDLIEISERVPELVTDNLRQEALRQEKARITPTVHSEVLDVGGLLDLVLSRSGPRLVIMNTVQSAAVIADALARKIHGDEYFVNLKTSKVLHLSTALAPIHREEIVKVVSQRLAKAKTDKNRDFTLVATSCVEAGVDFSFRSAFRERAGMANLIQVGGRVRRHSENFEPTLIDFKIEAPLINHHPTFDLSRQVLERLFNEGKVASESPADLVTEALRRELMSDTDERHKRLQKSEDSGDYPAVAELYKVIANDTKLILVDYEIIKKLQGGSKVDPREINRRSVQMWTNKLKKTCAYELDGFHDLYVWPEKDYDEKFLGYMKGMLPLLQFESKGFEII